MIRQDEIMVLTHVKLWLKPYNTPHGETRPGQEEVRKD